MHIRGGWSQVKHHSLTSCCNLTHASSRSGSCPLLITAHNRSRSVGQGEGMEDGWVGQGEGMEDGWVGKGEGMEDGWVGKGEGMEDEWVGQGEGMEDGWVDYSHA